MRVYPQCYMSMYCGRLECGGCKNLPVLDEFRAWVKRTGACVTDPIWCPGVYTIPAVREQKPVTTSWFKDVSKE